MSDVVTALFERLGHGAEALDITLGSDGKLRATLRGAELTLVDGETAAILRGFLTQFLPAAPVVSCHVSLRLGFPVRVTTTVDYAAPPASSHNILPAKGRSRRPPQSDNS